MKTCPICKKPATKYLIATCGCRTFDFKDAGVCSDKCLAVQVKELTNSGFLPVECKLSVVEECEKI
jgi:hypothetical protein